MKKIYGVACTIIFMAASCTSAKLTSEWVAPAYNPARIHKILVLAIINDKNEHIRDRMEKNLCTQLGIAGYTGISALEAYGPKLFEGMKENETVTKISGSGADLVIYISLLNKKKERSYVVPQQSSNYNHLFQYYDLNYNKTYTPGYYAEEEKYFWETNVYDVSTGLLIYSAKSRSFEFENTENMSRDHARLIIANLLKHKILLSAFMKQQ